MNIYKKIILALLGGFLFIIIAYAISFPTFTPQYKTEGGNLKAVLENLRKQTCNVSTQYIQGFDANGNHICRDKSSFNSLGLGSVGTAPSTANQGKYVKYLGNIQLDCGAKRYVKGFDTTTKQLICMDKNGNTTYAGANLTSITVPSISYPSNPGLPGGNYTANYFAKIFQTCVGNEYIKGYDTSGKICGSIVTGSCGSANGVATYSYPSGTACGAGTRIDIDTTAGDLEYNWNCQGDLGGDVSCSAPKRVDGGWSAWGGRGGCSVTCGGGTKSRSRSCTNPTPQNGGASCGGSNVDTTSCNTNACPITTTLTECYADDGYGNCIGYLSCSVTITQTGPIQCIGCAQHSRNNIHVLEKIQWTSSTTWNVLKGEVVNGWGYAWDSQPGTNCTQDFHDYTVHH